MKLLYITYIDFTQNARSGSSVRPQKMYEAFKELGINIKLLECQQNRRKERKHEVKKIMDWLDDNCPDICYIESPSGPIFNQIDLKLIKKINKMNIPIGYFYRDCFWLFPKIMKNIKFLKRKIIMLMNKRDLRVLQHCCDVLFFPTVDTIRLFDFANFKNSMVLPPACDFKNFQERKQSDITYKCLYIGAVSKVDGTFELINAFNILNNEFGLCAQLIIVARKNEWEKIYEKLDDMPSWIIIKHASGNELVDIYNDVDLAIFPRQKDEYIDLAMPVKLFEYIGFGKPVVTTKRNAPKNLIEDEKCGIVCEDDARAIAEAIFKFYSDEELRKNLYKNIRFAAKNNQWISRAQKVINNLVEIKK